MSTNKEENNQLVKNFLDRTFFSSWKDNKEDNYNSLELILNSTCNQKCSYCVTGDTKILMPDFGYKEIKDIKLNDKIIGFDEYRSAHKRRKFYPVKVTHIFKREVNELLKITFNDNSNILITPNHWILNGRSDDYQWKDASIYKVGQTAMSFPNVEVKHADTESYDYKIGYVIGTMKGDGSCKCYRGKNNGGNDMYKIRLAVKDTEITSRFSEFSNDIGINFYKKPFRISTYQGDVYEDALFANTQKVYDQIQELYKENFNKNKSYDYACGFLAGIYDAEGNIGKKSSTIRISNTDEEILNEIESSLNTIDIPYKREDYKNACSNIRILSPPYMFNTLKFIKIVKPAVTRKGLKNFYNTSRSKSKKIIKIEEIKGTKTVYNLETDSSTYVANDIMVHNCYYNKFGEELYPREISGKRNILKNTDMLLDWLKQNRMHPKIEVFGGEVFCQEVGFNVVEKVIDFFIRNDHPNNQMIIIPTNMTFINFPKRVRRIESLIEKARKNNINLILSASVDGKFCDKNRPYKNSRMELKRNDKYYDNVFSFCKRYNFRFHPMIYYDHINKWIPNFLWFQHMFKKFEMEWDSMYLLEIRNDGWTVETIKEYQKFLKFVVKWLYQKFNDPKAFTEYVFSQPRMNLFGMFGTIGRGIGCSIQSTVGIRLGDLTSVPCHRLSYPYLNTWKFITENSKIVDIEALNYSVMFSIASANIRNFPYCQDCAIKNLCGGGCLGAQYEINKDMFLPIQSVCMLEHGKVIAMLEILEEIGVLEYFIDKLTEEKRKNILLVRSKLRI